MNLRKSILAALVIVFAATVAMPVLAANNYIKTFREYENLLLRRSVFQAVCADKVKLEELKAKINEVIENKQIDVYYYLVESDENFRLKCEQIRQDYINNVGYHGLRGKFLGIDSLEKYMEKVPNGAFLGSLVQGAYERLSFDAKTAPAEGAARIAAKVETLGRLLERCVKLMEKQVPDTMVAKVLEWDFAKFWDWYTAGMRVSVSDEHQTGAAFQSSRLNLNTATVGQLAAIPGFDAELAASVHAFIAANKGVNTYRDLAAPIFTVLAARYPQQEAGARTGAILNSLETLTYLSDKENPLKKWTMMIFINADNDLEGAGIGDINEMEAVGSDENLNIVVQIDRHKDVVTETENSVYDVSNGNWSGTRRYYIERDDNPEGISSQVKGRLGETDAGSYKSLLDFVDWSVKCYPAEHYYLIIWNHGAGLGGISFDEESKNHITGEQLIDAVQGASKIAGRKIDIVNFDACLMAMVEVAWQLKGYTDIMVASEEVEPGYGLPYTDILKKMAEEPGIEPEALAKHVVDVYTKSYVLGGSQAQRKAQSVTYSAVKIDRMANLMGPIDEFAEALRGNFGDYVRTIHRNVDFKTRVYQTDGQYDLIDLASFLVSKSRNDQIRAAGTKLLKAYGYPMNQRKSLKAFEGPVAIVASKGSTVRWGVNGFNAPPDGMAPEGSVIDGDCVETEVTTAMEDGRYALVLGDLPASVDSVYYQVRKPGSTRFGKVRVASRKESFFTTDFPAHSPLLAEGHTAGMEYSYGLAINFRNLDTYDKSYETYQFAKDSKWDDFISHKGTFEKRGNILLVPDCGNDYRDDLHLRQYNDLLKGRDFDVYDFRYFGPLSQEVLDAYTSGAVIVFGGYNDDIGTLTDYYRRPDGSTFAKKRDIYPVASLVSYLEKGGRLFMNGHDLEKDKEAEALFGLMGFEVKGESGAEAKAVKGVDELLGVSGETLKVRNVNNEYHPPFPAVLHPLDGAVPVFTNSDGTCTAVRAESQGMRAVFFGFELESLPKNKAGAILDKVLDYLMK